jgi:carbonic anhydrase/acetyltransferase-like protein (isoleucine patch superfamily)
MKLEHDGKTPIIAASARIAPSAVICGDVEIGENCSVGFGCVLSAESGPIRIAANCIIMDSAVLRGVRRAPLTLGRNVLVGPRAYLCGCTVARDAFLATGCTVLNGAHVGERAEVRINAIVHIRTRLEQDAVVPLGWVAVGDPAEILPPDAHDRIWAVQKPLDFPGFVFGEGRPQAGESFMGRMMPRYGAALARHRDDRMVEE